MHAALGGGLQIGAGGPAPRRQARGQAEIGDGVDVVNFGLAHGGDAEFEFGHPGAAERGGDGDFLRPRERHAGGLLAIAQGGVNEMDAAGVHANRVAAGSSFFSSRLSRMASAVSMVAFLYQRFSG